MNRHAAHVVIVAVVALLGGCVAVEPSDPGRPVVAPASPRSTGPGDPVAAPSVTEPEPPPASHQDGSVTGETLAPVSRSDPVVKAIIELCGLDPSAINGMAKLASARDIPLYTRVTSKDPETQVDAPAWVVTYAGVVTLPRGFGWAENPTCVVIDGEPTLFMTGDFGRGDVVVPETRTIPDPPYALPPLEP